jgi:hypothetical protein
MIEKIFSEDLGFEKSCDPLHSCPDILCPVKACGMFTGE